MSFMRIRKTIRGWSGVRCASAVDYVNWSGSELQRIALMSKMRCTIRTAFVGCMVLGLLFLQSAAVLLPHDCSHTHGHGHASSATPDSAASTAACSYVWHWCSHPGCDHAHDRSTNAAETSPSSPAEPHDSHDSHECRICQTLFAARIVTSLVRCPDLTEDAIAVPDRHVPEVTARPQYRLPSRGPPRHVTG